MKYGAHCFLFTDHWSDQCLGLLDQARELELDCLEIAVGDDVTVSCSDLRRRAEELALELVVSPGAEWPKQYDLTAADARDRTAGLGWHKRQVDLAAELGAVAYTGALYGHPGTVKRRRPPPEEMQWAADGLHQLAMYAEAAGVEVVIEPMSHFRTHVVNTPEQAMHLLQLADQPNLQVLLDTYHMVTEVTDFALAVRTVGARLWGLHACGSHRGVPGDGILPWPAIFQALHEIEFDGYVILETYHSGVNDFAFQRGMFHNVCPDGNEFIRRGLAFLQAGLALPGTNTKEFHHD